MITLSEIFEKMHDEEYDLNLDNKLSNFLNTHTELFINNLIDYYRFNLYELDDYDFEKIESGNGITVFSIQTNHESNLSDDIIDFTLYKSDDCYYIYSDVFGQLNDNIFWDINSMQNTVMTKNILNYAIRRYFDDILEELTKDMILDSSKWIVNNELEHIGFDSIKSLIKFNDEFDLTEFIILEFFQMDDSNTNIDDLDFDCLSLNSLISYYEDSNLDNNINAVEFFDSFIEEVINSNDNLINLIELDGYMYKQEVIVANYDYQKTRYYFSDLHRTKEELYEEVVDKLESMISKSCYIYNDDFNNCVKIRCDNEENTFDLEFDFENYDSDYEYDSYDLFDIIEDEINMKDVINNIDYASFVHENII